ncbi:ankyrin repeat domain-containing protein 50 [Microdochium nivale]|nr:ankyrin repeat domain-containing protein 50 [Microdochium nivale]
MPLRPAPCPQATQTFRKAFEDLSQTITAADARGFSSTQIEDVRQAALQIEDRLASRGGLRNMKRLLPLFSGMEHYAKAVEIVCNGTPYLAWIWAPITLILRVASEYIEAFEKIIKGYALMAEPLQRFQTLGTAYSNSKEFHQTLAIFYADILEFHKQAYVFVKRSGWKLLFLTSWGRFQRRFNGILEDMARHEDLIDKEANALNISEARKMRDDLRSWREETVLSQRAADDELASRQLSFVTSWLKVDESDQLAIFDALSVEGETYPGTCDWLTNDEAVRSYLKSLPSTANLWLQGIPGAGKSILSSRLVRFMEISGFPVIRHFCNHSFASSLTYEHLMQQVVLQLIRNDVELILFVYETMVLGRKTPSRSTLQKLILEIVSVSSKLSSQTAYLWVVVDGIDECRDDHQKAIVSLLGLMAAKAAKSTTTTFKIMISSRDTPALRRSLKMSQVMSLGSRSDEIDQAIGSYVTTRLYPLYERLGEFGSTPSDIAAIESSIIRKSDGMFLYAKLVVDYLSHNIINSTAEILKSVNELPKKIVDFYQKILSQILTHLDGRSITRLKSVCSWIAYSKRPLKKHELLSALSFDFEEPYITNLASAHVLTICGPLLVEMPNNTFTFIHISLQEFLQSSHSTLRIDREDAAHEHTQVVLACLIHSIKTLRGQESYDKSLSVIKGLHGLLIYARQFWTHYLQENLLQAEMANQNTMLSSLLGKLDGHLAIFQLSATSTATGEEPSKGGWTNQTLFALPNVRAHVLDDMSCTKIDLTQGVTGDNSEPSLRPPSPLHKGGIESTLESYKLTIRNLLSEQYFTGVSAEHFESFKAQFRTTGFMCYFRSCPYASQGFESLEKCRHHERSHQVQLRCQVSGCQYPVFSSRQALVRHTNKHHQVLPPRRPIGQPRQLWPPHQRTFTHHDRAQFSESVSQPSRSSTSIRRALNQEPLGLPSAVSRILELSGAIEPLSGLHTTGSGSPSLQLPSSPLAVVDSFWNNSLTRFDIGYSDLPGEQLASVDPDFSSVD